MGHTAIGHVKLWWVRMRASVGQFSVASVPWVKQCTAPLYWLGSSVPEPGYGIWSLHGHHNGDHPLREVQAENQAKRHDQHSCQANLNQYGASRKLSQWSPIWCGDYLHLYRSQNCDSIVLQLSSPIPLTSLLLLYLQGVRSACCMWEIASGTRDGSSWKWARAGYVRFNFGSTFGSTFFGCSFFGCSGFGCSRFGSSDFFCGTEAGLATLNTSSGPSSSSSEKMLLMIFYGVRRHNIKNGSAKRATERTIWK